jgi:chromosome segregation protein
MIFSGSDSRARAGMAAATIQFDNADGWLPIDFSEVSVGRRAYRDGQNEYLINGQKVRLRDVSEMLAESGLAERTYTVIGQGLVDTALSLRAEERRELFEEAAGITRYKEKRKKTFRKLDETEKDLQRVEDILIEVRKKARSLEIQAEKAQKAKKFKKELEHLDKALNKHEYLQIKDELEPLEERIDNAEKEKKEIVSKAEKLEEEVEEARNALNDKERRQSEAQRRVSQLHSKIRDTETNLQITREKISNEESVIEQYTKDIEQSQKD